MNDQEFLVQKIRTQYTEKQHSAVDELKALDAKVKRPANVCGYTFGVLGALIMGSGMSLAMTELGTILGIANAMVPGVAVGVVGLIMVCINYPIYKGILGSRRKKYAQKIIALSDSIAQA